MNSTYFNITISNTYINAPNSNEIGGLIGSSHGDTITNCHQLGFLNSGDIIILGYDNVGGLVGRAKYLGNLKMVISKSGTYKGGIIGHDGTGLIFFLLFFFFEIFLIRIFC